MKRDIKKTLEGESIKRFEEAGKKWPNDVGLLWKTYIELLKQKWSEDFLKGYEATISDLILIKENKWNNFIE